jgi:hypothetical protein
MNHSPNILRFRSSRHPGAHQPRRPQAGAQSVHERPRHARPFREEDGRPRLDGVVSAASQYEKPGRLGRAESGETWQGRERAPTRRANLAQAYLQAMGCDACGSLGCAFYACSTAYGTTRCRVGVYSYAASFAYDERLMFSWYPVIHQSQSVCVYYTDYTAHPCYKHPST